MPVVDEARKTAKYIREILDDKKGIDIVILDLRHLSGIADYFVICSGTSTRHVEAMGAEVMAKMKTKGQLPKSAEGKGFGSWVLLDYSDVIVHLFYQDVRGFYNLEKLWEEAKRVR